jgi:predicted nucleic acid-binding protein
VLDASVTLAWAFEDEADDYADSVLDALVDNSALVPSIWGLEVANVLIVGERRKRLAPADSARFLTLLLELPLEVEETPVGGLEALVSLAREQKLSSYDAEYLAVAMRRGVPIATRDERLRQVATACGVGLFIARK